MKVPLALVFLLDLLCHSSLKIIKVRKMWLSKKERLNKLLEFFIKFHIAVYHVLFIVKPVYLDHFQEVCKNTAIKLMQTAGITERKHLQQPTKPSMSLTNLQLFSFQVMMMITIISSSQHFLCLIIPVLSSHLLLFIFFLRLFSFYLLFLFIFQILL